MHSIGIPELLVLCGPPLLLGYALFLLASMPWKKSHPVKRVVATEK